METPARAATSLMPTKGPPSAGRHEPLYLNRAHAINRQYTKKGPDRGAGTNGGG